MEYEYNIKHPPEDNFGPVYIKVFLDKRLNTYDKLVYACLKSFGKTCHAAKETMAIRCSCSRRQVQKCLAKLEELGYIRRSEDKKAEKYFVHIIPIALVDTPEYPREGIEVSTIENMVPKGCAPDSHKAEKINKEVKHIGEGNKEAERLYKLYPSKTDCRPRVAKSRSDIDTISVLLKTGYPVERAIREIALKTDYPKDLKSFLHKNNLPDMEEMDKPAANTGPCNHEMDWAAKLEQISQYVFKGPCIHCGSRIMREKK